MQDYFEQARYNAERHWGHANMVRPSFGTIGKITQAQMIGSILPTAETWNPISYSHLKPAPPVHEVTVQQVFTEPEPQVDADGDAIMVDAQDIIPE